jgi:hypothetical protein
MAPSQPTMPLASHSATICWRCSRYICRRVSPAKRVLACACARSLPSPASHRHRRQRAPRPATRGHTKPHRWLTDPRWACARVPCGTRAWRACLRVCVCERVHARAHLGLVGDGFLLARLLALLLRCLLRVLLVGGGALGGLLLRAARTESSEVGATAARARRSAPNLLDSSPAGSADAMMVAIEARR